MPKNQEFELLGLGLYSTTEAAAYARVPSDRLSRWLYGHRPVIQPQMGHDRRIVTFLDFAQSLSVSDIRRGFKIPLQKIRRAYHEAQTQYGVRYPLALRHGVFVFGNLDEPETCELGIHISDSGESQKDFIQRSVQLTGKRRGNQLISQIVKDFSRNIVFSGAGGLASRYIAFEQDGHTIVMDPEIRFGKPFMLDAGYEAATLAEAAECEGTIERAARMYDVTESAIQTALDFYKQLKSRTPPTPPEPLAA